MVDELIKDIYKLKTDRQDLEDKITYYKAQRDYCYIFF